MAYQAPPFPEYWQRLEECQRPTSPDDQRVAVALYRELAKGEAVSDEQLAGALGATPVEARALLERPWIKCSSFTDQEGRVAGFGGLATRPMHHRFEVDGRTLWTWCAWDSLFIPQILGQTARVASDDPETGETVRLVVTPTSVEEAAPAEPLVSFVEPEAEVFRTSAANAMANFCHFVFFFASRDSGERWTARHPGTFLYPLDDAIALARRLVAHRFGTELARSARAEPASA